MIGGLRCLDMDIDDTLRSLLNPDHDPALGAFMKNAADLNAVLAHTSVVFRVSSFVIAEDGQDLLRAEWDERLKQYAFSPLD
jgi:hypothetical protein